MYGAERPSRSETKTGNGVLRPLHRFGKGKGREPTDSNTVLGIFAFISSPPPLHTRKWRVTANVKKCAVGVRNEDKVSPVTFKWK